MAAAAVGSRRSFCTCDGLLGALLLFLVLPGLGSSSDLDSIEVVKVEWERNKHAASYRKESGPKAAGTPGCIIPSPFGQQCTGHRVDLLGGCLVTAGCQAMVCPDQAPYNRGNPKKKVRRTHHTHFPTHPPASSHTHPSASSPPSPTRPIASSITCPTIIPIPLPIPPSIVVDRGRAI